MATKNFKLAEDMIKSTTSFRVGLVDYELKSDSMTVWSTNKHGVDDCFHSTEIIGLFNFAYSTYITYDAERGKCVLRIF